MVLNQFSEEFSKRDPEMEFRVFVGSIWLLWLGAATADGDAIPQRQPFRLQPGRAEVEPIQQYSTLQALDRVSEDGRRGGVGEGELHQRELHQLRERAGEPHNRHLGPAAAVAGALLEDGVPGEGEPDRDDLQPEGERQGTIIPHRE